MHPYQPVDFALATIAVIAFIALIAVTWRWSDGKLLGLLFDAEEEARFFHRDVRDVREERRNGRK